MFDATARKGLFEERNTPEFATVVVLAAGLGLGIVVRLLRRRGWWR
jgi:hypothetical protein